MKMSVLFVAFFLQLSFVAGVTFTGLYFLQKTQKEKTIRALELLDRCPKNGRVSAEASTDVIGVGLKTTCEHYVE